MGGQLSQYRMNPEVKEVLLAAAYEWTKSGSIRQRTSGNTEDAMAIRAGKPRNQKGG